MLLTDPLDEDSRHLLHLIHVGSGQGTGEWPVWQWVANQAAERNMSAEAVLVGLPTWQYDYRSVRGGRRGVAPALEDRLSLTVHGLAQIGDVVLLPAFLAALAEASTAAAGQVTTPQEVSPLVLSGRDLVSSVRARCGYRGDQRHLYMLLDGEPATWSVQGDLESGDWTWDITRLGLQRFTEVRSTTDYLEQLELMVGLPLPAAAPTPPLPPLALLEALDHLDAHWRLRTRSRLLTARRLEAVATLAQPVSTAADLQTAYSALADLLDGLNPGGAPSREKSLNRLQARLPDVVDEDHLPQAMAAVTTLRQLVQVRVDRQHSGSDAFRRAQVARRELGLSPVPGHPGDEWEAARHACVGALRDLRAAVATPHEPTT